MNSTYDRALVLLMAGLLLAGLAPVIAGSWGWLGIFPSILSGAFSWGAVRLAYRAGKEDEYARLFRLRLAERKQKEFYAGQ